MTVNPLRIDHLVIAARSLDEGAQFVASTLGCEMTAGGAHPSMRTHNRLLNLWNGVYLEVIAIDPGATRPVSMDTPRPRLFALDDPALQQRLDAGPQLVHWVARVDRPRSLGRWQAQYPSRIEPVVAMSRGDNRWQLTVSDDGAFPAWQGAGDGLLPSLIQWDSHRHPGSMLPETGIALTSLTGFHARAHLISEQLAWLGATSLMNVEFTDGLPRLVAQFELPDGSTVTIGDSPTAAPDESPTQPAKKRAKSRASEAKEALPDNER